MTEKTVRPHSVLRRTMLISFAAWKAGITELGKCH